MKHVRQTVEEILRQSSVPQHTQSISFSQYSHQELRALAEFLGRTKSSLAGELLEAAIRDAIDHLEDVPFRGVTNEEGKEYTVAEYIRRRADALYAEFLEREKQEHKILDEIYAQQKQGVS